MLLSLMVVGVCDLIGLRIELWIFCCALCLCCVIGFGFVGFCGDLGCELVWCAAGCLWVFWWFVCCCLRLIVVTVGV